jgi:hypothetical protein
MPATTLMSPERAQAAMDELIKHGLAREIVVNGVKGIQLTDAGVAHAQRLRGKLEWSKHGDHS